MKGTFNHIQYNVSNSTATAAFYRELLGYFEMQTIHDGDGMLGVGDGHLSLWVMPTREETRAQVFNRDANGLNHLGIHVESAADVDTFHSDFMQPHGIPAAFDTPRARPEFGGDYYQVMFVDPEGLAIEVFHANYGAAQ